MERDGEKPANGVLRIFLFTEFQSTSNWQTEIDSEKICKVFFFLQNSMLLSLSSRSRLYETQLTLIVIDLFLCVFFWFSPNLCKSSSNQFPSKIEGSNSLLSWITKQKKELVFMSYNWEMACILTKVPRSGIREISYQPFSSKKKCFKRMTEEEKHFDRYLRLPHKNKHKLFFSSFGSIICS